MRGFSGRNRRRGRRAWAGGWFVALGLSASLAAGACSETTGPGERSLEVAAARWADRGPTDYSYVFDQLCECLYTQSVRLTVRGGEVVSAEALPGSSPPIGPLDPELFPTVDELFDRLRIAAGSDPVRFDVSFDPELGYPTRADVDVSAQVADDEYSFTARFLVADAT